MKIQYARGRATLAALVAIAALALICAGAIRLAYTAWHADEPTATAGVRLMDDSDDQIQQMINEQQMVASQQAAEQQNEMAQQQAQQAEQQGLMVEQQVNS